MNKQHLLWIALTLVSAPLSANPEPVAAQSLTPGQHRQYALAYLAAKKDVADPVEQALAHLYFEFHTNVASAMDSGDFTLADLALFDHDLVAREAHIRLDLNGYYKAYGDDEDYSDES